MLTLLAGCAVDRRSIDVWHLDQVVVSTRGRGEPVGCVLDDVVHGSGKAAEFKALDCALGSEQPVPWINMGRSDPASPRPLLS